MGFEVADSVSGENMIFFFLRLEIGGVWKICSISLGIEISLICLVIFATDSSEEETEDNDEEADESESLDAAQVSWIKTLACFF